MIKAQTDTIGLTVSVEIADIAERISDWDGGEVLAGILESFDPNNVDDWLDMLRESLTDKSRAALEKIATALKTSTPTDGVVGD